MAGPAPLTAQDRLDVINLVASYAAYLDTADLDGYVDNFAPGGVIEHSAGRCEGQAEIRAWVGGLLGARRPGDTSSPYRHVLGIPLIEGDGERCSARTYVLIPQQRDGELTLPMVLTYVDSCVKLDGRWRFAKRIIQPGLVSAARRSETAR